MIKTPTKKTLVSSATRIGAGVVGAKLSDGVVSIMPESTTSYKKGLVAAVALVAAASVDAKTTMGEVAQAALVGMAVKQGTDALTEVLVPSVDAQDSSKLSGKFINAVVGHTNQSDTVQTATTAISRMANPYQWNSFQQERVEPVAMPRTLSVTGY